MKKALIKINSLIAAAIAASLLAGCSGASDIQDRTPSVTTLAPTSAISSVTEKPEETSTPEAATPTPSTPKETYTVTVTVKSAEDSYAVHILAGELSLEYERKAGTADDAEYTFTKTYEEGNTVKLTAVLAENAPYTVKGWTGDYSSDSSVITFTAEKNAALTVNVEKTAENLALGAQVLVSGSEIVSDGGVFTDGGATDGSYNTKFSTGIISVSDDDANVSSPVAIVIDLGGEKTFNTVTLTPYCDIKSVDDGIADYPCVFEIMVSSDGVTYKTVKTVRSDTAPEDSFQTYSFSAVSARYIKLNILRLGSIALDETVPGAYRVRIAEAAVYNA